MLFPDNQSTDSDTLMISDCPDQLGLQHQMSLNQSETLGQAMIKRDRLSLISSNDQATGCISFSNKDVPLKMVSWKSLVYFSICKTKCPINSQKIWSSRLAIRITKHDNSCVRIEGFEIENECHWFLIHSTIINVIVDATFKSWNTSTQ